MSEWQRYKEKPQTYEAIQWFPGVEILGANETVIGGRPVAVIPCGFSHTVVDAGDFIVKDRNGHLFRRKPDVFEALFELCEI